MLSTETLESIFWRVYDTPIWTDLLLRPTKLDLRPFIQLSIIKTIKFSTLEIMFVVLVGNKNINSQLLVDEITLETLSCLK